MSSTTRVKQLGLRALWVFLCVPLCLSLAWAQDGAPPASYHVFPRFVAYGNVSSGIALFNPSSRAATVVLTLRGVDGAPIGGGSNPVAVTVPPKGQMALVAGELFGSEVLVDASLTVARETPGR